MNPVYVAQDDMATGAGCVEKGKSGGSGVWCLGKPFPLTSSPLGVLRFWFGKLKENLGLPLGVRVLFPFPLLGCLPV